MHVPAFARQVAFVAFCAGFTVPSAMAQDAPAFPATFVVVHGIPGRDLAASFDPVLPVDVLIDGKYCLLQGFTFGSIAGPFQVPAGSYTVAISLANPVAPCSNSPVISATADLTAGSFNSIVAALSTKKAPTAEIYPVYVSPVGAGKQRFIAAHAADAPEVEVKVVSEGPNQETVKGALAPGHELTAVADARGSFNVSISPIGTNAVIGPITVQPGNQGVALIYAVGSAASGSATLISKTIPNVF